MPADEPMAGSYGFIHTMSTTNGLARDMITGCDLPKSGFTRELDDIRDRRWSTSCGALDVKINALKVGDPTWVAKSLSGISASALTSTSRPSPQSQPTTGS